MIIVLDRDGVLNVNSKDPQSPYYYVLRKEDLILKDGVREAVSLLQGHTVILATRQKCISKGLITRAAVDEINQHLMSLLGLTFAEVYVVESGDDKTEAFVKIVAKYGHDVVLIDDSTHECNAASAAGLRSICSAELPAALKLLGVSANDREQTV